jgi:DNA-binding PadR family transcriptional regulator
MRDLYSRPKNGGDIARALEVLQSAGLVTRTREKTDGRPVERWVRRTGGATESTGATEGSEPEGG